MATVQYFDALGPTSALDLVGESGMLPLGALAGSYPTITSTYQDNGSRIRQLIYSGGALRLRHDYTYATVVTPFADKIISQVNVYFVGDELLQQWSGLSVSLASVIATNAVPFFQGEDQVVGNASANVLQGTSGDDLLLGRAEADTLYGGRADDTLVGGPGDGGLGTDFVAFCGPSTSHRWVSNADRSISPSEVGTFASDGIDKLYDVEWLLFNYGTASQAAVRTSKLLCDETSPIFCWRQFDPLDPTLFRSAPASSPMGGLGTLTPAESHCAGWSLQQSCGILWTE